MPRGPRIDYPGLLHHVIIRGIERKNILETDLDKTDFLERIEKVFKKSDAKIYAWALMSNHSHLLIKTGNKLLSEMMRRILTGYAISYNKRHKRSGYLYQGRYKSIVCEEETYLLELVRYIHLNPVRAGIVKTVDDLDNYKWTGHNKITGKKEVEWQDTKEILTQFGKNKKTAIKQYKEFIYDGINQGKREDLSGGGLIRSLGGIGKTMLVKGNNRQMYDQRILGNGDFVENILKDAEKKDEIESKMDIDELINRVGKYYDIEPYKIINKKNQKGLGSIKAILVNIGKERLGISGKSLAQKLNLSKSGISKLNRLGEKILEDEGKVLSEVLR